jgi:hypothetical protein
MQKNTQNIGTTKYIQKHWRIQNLGGYKNIGANRIFGGFQNLVTWKNIGVYRNVGAQEKTRHPAIMAQQEK